MGIKNLNKLLKEHCSEGIRTISLKKLQNTCIAIDTSIYLYKYSYFGDALKNFERQIAHLLSNKITPVYLFDGKPGAEKDELIKKRREQYRGKKEEIKRMKDRLEEIKAEIASITDDNGTVGENNEETLQCKREEIDMLMKQIKKKEKTTIKIDWDMVKDLKKMLDEAGIFYFECPGETDLYVKEFFKRDLIQYVITEDLDFLTHQCPKVLYNYKASSNTCSFYNYNIIIKELGLSPSMFIDLCIMYGCDYTGTIKGIGHKTGYKFIKQYGSIEEILKNKKKFSDCKCDYKMARTTFTCSNDLDVTSVRIKKKDTYDLSDNLKIVLKKFQGQDKINHKQKANFRKFFRPKKK